MPAGPPPRNCNRPSGRRRPLWCLAGLEEVQKNLLEHGLSSRANALHSGPRRRDNPSGTRPQHIALLRLDTDWYESTRHELTHLYPRLVPGGVLIIDDYGYWQGARQATDEFLATLEKPPLLCRIDFTGRMSP